MKLWKALKAAWREFWRVWKDEPAPRIARSGAVVSLNPRCAPKPDDVPAEGLVYVGDQGGKRRVIADTRAKTLFLIDRKQGRTAELWHNGELRDWNPR